MNFAKVLEKFLLFRGARTPDSLTSRGKQGLSPVTRDSGVFPVSLQISLTHHYSLPTGRALLPSDQETDALGSRVRLKQKCDYSVFSTGCCSGEEGDPRWRLIFGLLPGLRSCLLIWQILGDSACFLSSLKYMSGKSLHPHRPCCVCGNGDRLGGGGGTGWLVHGPPSGCGKKSWPRQALCRATTGASNTAMGQSCIPLGSARAPSPARVLPCSDYFDERPSWLPLPCGAPTCLW